MSTLGNALALANDTAKILDRYRLHPDFLGFELTHVNQIGSTGDSPLHIACRRGTEEEILDLLACGADINMRGDIGNTPLHFAAMAGRQKIVQLLLQKGSRVTSRNDFDETALQVARQGGKRDVVDFLTRYPAQL